MKPFMSRWNKKLRLRGKSDKEFTRKQIVMRRIGRFALIGFLIVIVIGGIWIRGVLNAEQRFQKAVLNPLTIPGSKVSVEPVGKTQPDGAPNNPTNTADLSLSPNTSEPTASPAASDKKTSSFNVVLIGTDTWGGEISRADTIMVVHVMPEQRKVNIVSVPRDTRVYVQNVGYTKINHAHIVGESKGGNEHD